MAAAEFCDDLQHLDSDSRLEIVARLVQDRPTVRVVRLAWHRDIEASDGYMHVTTFAYEHEAHLIGELVRHGADAFDREPATLLISSRATPSIRLQVPAIAETSVFLKAMFEWALGTFLDHLVPGPTDAGSSTAVARSKENPA